tara:strand:- start:4315 stop:4656 length:342 start_codon:yes stop_codon:yes gene_type:complete
MKLTKSKLKQVIKEECRHILRESRFARQWEELKAQTLEKLATDPEDALRILADAVDTAGWWLNDEEDQIHFVEEVLEESPDIALDWREVFRQLNADALDAHKSQQEDEATNPW